METEVTRYGSHTESRMRENCTYGSKRGRAYPTGASRSTLHPPVEATNAVVIGKREFDPTWNLVKIVRRGLGEVVESVTVDEERVRFDIRIR